MIEESTFNAYIESEKEKGLVDLKIMFANDCTASKEDIYRELNAMNKAFEQGRYTEITYL